jgi:hypothetical protein
VLQHHKLCEVLIRNYVATPNPGLLAAMLKAHRLSGVMRWRVNFTESGFKGETNLAGWDGLWLDTSHVKSTQDFVDVVAIQTSNSNFVGRTIEELIEKLVVAEDAVGGLCIAWSGWQDLLKASPQAAQDIADSFDLACQDISAVVLVCDTVGSFLGISELAQG